MMSSVASMSEEFKRNSEMKGIHKFGRTVKRMSRNSLGRPRIDFLEFIQGLPFPCAKIFRPVSAAKKIQTDSSSVWLTDNQDSRRPKKISAIPACVDRNAFPESIPTTGVTAREARL
jgi:hypothetical protein